MEVGFNMGDAVGGAGLGAFKGYTERGVTGKRSEWGLYTRYFF